MATLNNQVTYDADDDDDESSGVAAGPRPLSRNWRSWPVPLRRAVGVASGLAVTMLVILYFFHEQDIEYEQKLNAATSNKTQAQTKLRESGQERDTIVKQLPVLKELEKKGVFGEEKRLEWVEQLRIIEKRWPGVAIKYDISPQRLIPKEGANGVTAPTAPIPAGAKLPNGDPVKSFGVFATEMRLHLVAVHEGDILAIVDELKTANLGLFTLKKCHMKRPHNTAITDETPHAVIGAPLSIDCTLSWLSMNTY